MALNPNRDSSDPAVLVRRAALPLRDDTDLAPILAEIGQASLVLLGESTHGTHDFYALRAQITRALIANHGFSAVAIEGDWPDACRVNRYVNGAATHRTSAEALGGFARFPIWMWRNTAVAGFVDWLRRYNASLADPSARAGFYGLDLYSLHASMAAVIDYLERHDPPAAEQARRSYGCFDQYGRDTDTYAWASTQWSSGSCEEAVARELVRLRERRAALLERGESSDEFFYAEQNARLAKNAERYYRTMFHGRTASWNLRDEHMAETLEALRTHLLSAGRPAKIVVWAHNSHLGDARATESAAEGQLNLGQLVRERHGAACRLIGFTTYSGRVIAASEWGEPGEVKDVRPGLAGSCEDLFHQTRMPRFFLPLRAGTPVFDALAEPRLQRAIGVIYRPETERWSHYFQAAIAEQFDAVIHLDETKPLEPLDRVAAWDPGEVPETFPSGV